MDCLANPCDLTVGIQLFCYSFFSTALFLFSNMNSCYVSPMFELALLINSTSNALGVSAKNSSLEDDCYVVTLLFKPKIFLLALCIWGTFL